MRSVSSVEMPRVALRRAVSQPPSSTPAATNSPKTWIVTGPTSMVGNGTYGIPAGTATRLTRSR